MPEGHAPPGVLACASISLVWPVTNPTARLPLRAHENRAVPRLKTPLEVRGSPGPQRAPRRPRVRPQSPALLTKPRGRPTQTMNHTKTKLGLASQSRRLGIGHLRPRTFIKGINGRIQDLQLGRRSQSKPGLDLDEAAREQRLRSNGFNVVVDKDLRIKVQFVLQFGVSRGVCEVFLSQYGRVDLSAIVSKFGPKRFPHRQKRPRRSPSSRPY